MQIISPFHTEIISNVLTIGNLSVIGIVAQKAVLPEAMPPGEKTAERLLYEVIIDYIYRWNQTEDELSSLLQTAITRPLPTIVTSGGVVEVTYLLDTPHDITLRGVYMDADLRIVETVGATLLPDNSDPQKTFMQLSSLCLI